MALAGFGVDGWLGAVGDASLVRVSGGPARVLFTIYQAADSAHEPPKLQIMRLTVPVAPPAPPAPVQAEIVAHQYGSGDIGGRVGAWVGARGSRRWLEGFALAPTGLAAADIEYQAVLGRGWMSPWSEGGQFCGSRGMSLPILGLRVRLRGKAAETHALSLSATFVDGSTAGPVTDGGACEAESLAALEAFQVSIAPKQAVGKRTRRTKT